MSNYLDDLSRYSAEMLNAYRESDLRGEELWSDFLTTFRTYAIHTWTRAQATRWAGFLTGRDLYVSKVRNKSRCTALVELLYRPHHFTAGACGNDEEEVQEQEEAQISETQKEASLIINREGRKTTIKNPEDAETKIIELKDNHDLADTRKPFRGIALGNQENDSGD